MLGAIYIGLSGLSAYQKGLTAVSNNVTNLNSSGFKASDVSFTDVYGTKGGNGLAYAGNAQGGGSGVNFGGSTINFAQGELRSTGRDLDLSIDGAGFLVLMDGNDLSYARTGSFSVNEDGFIVLRGTDLKLAALDGDGTPVALNIDSVRTGKPEPTSTIKFSDNLSSTATDFSIGDVKVFDNAGKEHVWQIAFSKDPDQPDSWTVKVTDEDSNKVGSKTLRFKDGIIDPETAKLQFGSAKNGPKVIFDFSENVSSYSSGEVSSLRTESIDGHGVGTISRLNINAEGHVEIGYSNGEKMDLGAVAIADFRDLAALVQLGAGRFEYKGHGQQSFLASGDPRVGNVVSGRLEASNVDLGAQFGDLILIQRGFQASSQIVSVSNDMIQQLFGIRGQG